MAAAVGALAVTTAAKDNQELQELELPGWVDTDVHPKRVKLRATTW